MLTSPDEVQPGSNFPSNWPLPSRAHQPPAPIRGLIWCGSGKVGRGESVFVGASQEANTYRTARATWCSVLDLESGREVSPPYHWVQIASLFDSFWSSHLCSLYAESWIPRNQDQGNLDKCSGNYHPSSHDKFWPSLCLPAHLFLAASVTSLSWV